MSSAELDLILEQALQLRATGVALEACLERFPDHAEALRPLLEAADLTAAGLDAATPLPTPDLARGRARLIAAARSSRSRAPAAPWRWAVAALIAIGLVLTMGVASSRALPGDLLYPVKRAIEDARFALAGEPEAREALRTEVSGRRQAEVEALIGLGREASLVFEGVVEDATPSTLTVSGIRIDGDHQAEVGDTVRVGVRVTNEGVLLEDLTRIAAPPARPEPTVAPETRAPIATSTLKAIATERSTTATAANTRVPDASPIEATRHPAQTPLTAEPTALPDQPTTPPERPTRAPDQPTTVPDRPTPEPPRPTERPSPTPERRRP
ncbi:MAG TPA: DUF5667 domain-containing protein [Anaerolineales bacterium]|nr:DUF5667 domain-containing protein [Anaerolineales bacterium]